MTLMDQLNVLHDTDMLHIRNTAGETMYIGYKGILDDNLKAEDLTRTVTAFRMIPEIRHKNYKNMGLTAPMQPEETPQWSFSDLMMTIYYTITVQA